MFSTLGLFNDIACPCNDVCTLPNCVFHHQRLRHASLHDADSETSQVLGKRRRPSPGPEVDKIAHVALTPRVIKSQTFVGSLVAKPTSPAGEVLEGEFEIIHSKSAGKKLPVSEHSPTPAQDVSKSGNVPARRPISPPSVRRAPRPPLSSSGPPVTKVQESLNPRMIKNDPAGHQTRTLYLKKLHEGMARLNNEIGLSKDTDVKALKLKDGELITLALDEEEKLVTENPLVYSNIIKLRMVTYKRMTLEQWKVARLEAKQESLASKFPKALVKEAIHLVDMPQLVGTGLFASEELQILRQFIANQKDLAEFGYITAPPTAKEIAAVKEGVSAAQGWEQCSRCKTRFKVFPDRREDGALTSGGRCTHHHGRIQYPDKDRKDAYGALVARGGPNEQTYSCCGQPRGASAGCTTAETHVFKVEDGKRLASILQFERTPENPNVGVDQAVCFDCEMGYTVYGMELIRLTATRWPEGRELLDVLVRPLGAILDLNSRYSGVRPEHFLEALPYNLLAAKASANELAADGTTLAADGTSLPPIVESPMIARSLLFKLLSPTTPLIGHAIENDLNTTRIVHPCIVDTVLLFPHPTGLPRRRALKALAKQMLNRDIQMGGASGHDSKEDALATGELARWKVGRKWKDMQVQGWKRQDGKLVPPVQKASLALGVEAKGTRENEAEDR